ncbi:M57 family metalloprotease [Chitinophaga sp. RCC_12]|uniref:M57 family metalloprotease n=1 Tax=Chitinophaga sp. RCC_12 TaxID=3239226 RepID=UPI00352528E3
MIKHLRLLSCGLILLAAFQSCTKSPHTDPPKTDSLTALDKIRNLGFSTDGVLTVPNGYVVEDDIFLSEADLNQTASSIGLKIAGNELYKTSSLVTGLPRVITINASALPSYYKDAVDRANRRFNSLNLRIKFWRVQANGDITITPENLGATRKARIYGFPDSNGNPADSIKLNTQLLGSNPDLGYLVTLITHEIGHAIGFRHTKYLNGMAGCVFDTASSNGSAGAISVSGTPSTTNALSWMLACNSGYDRPFNANDTIALNRIYGENLPPNSNQFVNLAVTPNGTILGVGADMLVYSKATLTSPWTLVPNSSVVLGVAVTPTGQWLGVGTDLQIWSRTEIGWNAAIPNSGLVTALTVMQNGTIVGVGTDSQLYTLSSLGYNWAPAAVSTPIVTVATMNDGSLLGVGRDHLLYQRTTLDAPWVVVPNSGAVIAATVMSDGTILGVGTDRAVYKRASLSGTWVKI